MSDNKRKRGRADRIRVAGKQRYELYYVARKFHVSAQTVRDIIKRVGNSRRRVYAQLADMAHG